MINRKKLSLRSIGLVLIVAALALTGFNIYTADRAARRSQHILTEMHSEHAAFQRPARPPRTEDTLIIPDYILNPDMDMPVIEVDGHGYIGVLEIPSLNLKLPVMHQWSYPNLKISPCRYSGSAYLDDMVIAAHNYVRHFGQIKQLSSGETVTFIDTDGNVFSYVIVLVEILDSTDIAEMNSGDWDLSLFTCTLDGAYRVTVRCKRTASI